MKRMGESGLIHETRFPVSVDAHDLVKQCIQHYDVDKRRVIYNHIVYGDLSPGDINNKRTSGIPTPTRWIKRSRAQAKINKKFKSSSQHARKLYAKSVH